MALRKTRLTRQEAYLVSRFIRSSVLHLFLTDHDVVVARMGNGGQGTAEFSASSGPKGIAYTFAPRPQSERVEDRVVSWKRLRQLFAKVPQELVDALMAAERHPHIWSRWERTEPIAKRILASMAVGGQM